MTALDPGLVNDRDDDPDAGPRRGGWALVGVGVLFLSLQLIVVPRPFGYSTDEVTYLAMVDPAVPELYWSAPRAWGTPILAAPVAMFSAGLQLTRIYFAGLSSLLLAAAFWPWLRVLHPAVAPLAALLFCTTWIPLYYGSLIFPNLYVGLGAVAALGWFLRAVQQPAGWRAAVCAGAAVALVALVRPTDSVLVVAPVFVLALLVRRLRRPAALTALVIGALVGWLPWVVEAYLRFGGPLARLRTAESAGPKGLAPDLSALLIFPRLLDGTPTYCCEGGTVSDAGPVPLLLTAWLVAIPFVLVVVATVFAIRHGRLTQLLVVCLPALLLGSFYLLLPAFITLRFVLPVFALTALPVAAGLVDLLIASRGRWRTVLVGLTVVALGTHLALMLPKAERILDQNRPRRSFELKAAAALRPLVNRKPCLMVGSAPRATIYYLGCAMQPGRPGGRPPARVRQALAEGHLVVAVLRRRPPKDSYLATWERVRIPDMPRKLRVYVPPS